MTRIEAAEESFGKANTFYILAWIVTALVIATAFVDYRSYQREVTINSSQLNLYSDLERNAAEIAKRLRSNIYLSSSYSSEEAGIEQLRRLRSKVIADLVWVDDNFSQMMPDLSTDDRLVIQPALNFMRAMLMLNDASEDYSPAENEPALLFAEHEAGSYLTAKKIEHLRIEDATRYLWISSLGLEQWEQILSNHKAALLAGTQRAEDMAEELRSVVANTSSENQRRDRKTANELWTKWLKSSTASGTNESGGTTEARRRASLTLAQTSEFLDQAMIQRAELDLQAGGQGSVVEIPVISIPLQLRDASIAAPWILAFCSLSILIYTLRALRYAPASVDENTIVGSVPSFYAAYGFGTAIGIFSAMFLLWLPSILIAILLPTLQPGLVSASSDYSYVFFAGVVVSLLFGLFTLFQIPAVLKLIDDDIAVKKTPK